MKNYIVIFFIALFVFSCQEQAKIGFVDNKKVVNDYDKKKGFEAKFQTKIDKFNKKADSLEKAIQMEAQLFQVKAQTMSQKKAEAEYQALLQKKQMLDYQLKSEEQALQTEAQTKIDSLVQEVKLFVKDYGKTNGYTYILGANEAGSVMYGAESNDLTEEILTKLNTPKDDNSED